MFSIKLNNSMHFNRCFEQPVIQNRGIWHLLQSKVFWLAWQFSWKIDQALVTIAQQILSIQSTRYKDASFITKLEKRLLKTPVAHYPRSCGSVNDPFEDFCHVENIGVDNYCTEFVGKNLKYWQFTKVASICCQCFRIASLWKCN